jgi:hypothetical protein
LEGYIYPLNICNGLAHAITRPYTEEEWETLPHIIWMPDEEWDATVLNQGSISCAEVTGGEIESPECNSGETSNVHTMISLPKFNYGETNKEQICHDSV